MNKIHQIQLQNFKFFGDTPPIEIGGKHVLLYGENGSGKSSLYWALYTLLESTNKKTNEVKAYFELENNKSLLNIHSGTPENAFIEVVLTDGTVYKIAHAKAEVHENEAIIKKAKEASYASDFLNYRFLFKVHNFKHGDEMDIFHLFEAEILRYLKVNVTQVFIREVAGNVNFSNALDVFKALKGQIEILGTRTQLITTFRTEFGRLISTINEKGNQILNEKLGYQNAETGEYNLEFLLESNVDTINITKTQSPFVKLKIKKYYGVEGDKIPKPQSFLNEAKWSAIGLAIRLAILDFRLQNSATNEADGLQILVLDDLMVSLDMGNRDKVLNLIFSEYLANYQVFIMTHDKVFFEHCKNYIEDVFGEKDAEWGQHFSLFEMYSDDTVPNQEKPLILPYKTAIQKAWHYYREKDYAVCGNNLRISLEEFFTKFITKQYRKVGDNYASTLNEFLICAKKYFTYLGFDNSLLVKLDRYKKRALNPASHYNPNTNYFKSELQDIFSIYEQLQKFSNKILIPKDSRIKLLIKSQSNKEYVYEIEIADDIRCYNNGISSPYFLDKDIYPVTVKKFSIFENANLNTEESPNRKDNARTLLGFYELTCKGIERKYSEQIVRETDMYQVFTDINGKTLRELMTS
jgi:energy-coupling factor transporter ATP-binding protein EcfA2